MSKQHFQEDINYVLMELYDVRQHIIFTVGDADKLSHKSSVFLDILKETIYKIEKLEEIKDAI